MASLVTQPSLLGSVTPGIGRPLCPSDRLALADGAWVDRVPLWLVGHQTLFDQLIESVAWEAQRRPMYDRIVAVPRLIGKVPEDLPPVIGEIAAALDVRYGMPFPSIGIALYRDGRDSVAWHGDQVARDLHQAIVATVSLGEPRPFLLRPKGGGPSRRFTVGHGDLLVMGGTCQRTWDHCVPKTKKAGPRIALMFRPRWR